MNAHGLDLAFIDLVHARRVEHVEFLAAETQVRDFSVGRGDDAIHATRLIAHLDAKARGDVKPAIAINTQAVGGTVKHGHSTSEHDILVLVNLEYARADSKKLLALVAAERAKGGFKRAVSVFAATNDMQQARPRWILIWQESTDRFRDSKLPVGSRLSERHQESDEQPLIVYPDAFAGVQSVHWFCNDAPPAVYVAVVLWAKIFPRLMTSEQREEWALDSDCQGIINFEISVQAICDAARQFLGRYLTKSVIKSVLEILRKAKLVTKKSEDSYVIHFRRFKLTQFSSEDEDVIEEAKLDHQREGIIRAIVRGDKQSRSSGGRIPRRPKPFTDKRQIEMF